MAEALGWPWIDVLGCPAGVWVSRWRKREKESVIAPT